MQLEEVLESLREMGSESSKRIISRHGVKEPYYGVKIGDLKKLVKPVKKDQKLALELFDTGIHDAMYLAGLTVDPKAATKETLEAWVRKAYWYLLAEYTVAGVAAESPYALELARAWIEDADEMIACAGWSTYANYVSLTDDAALDLAELRGLLSRVAETIHGERNRVRYNMNGFVIAVGAYVVPLHEEALAVADRIGKVHVDVGDTACKVPLAAEYIRKIEAMGKLGAKKKTCIC
ncbi:MAG TPA: DNA alkylation repair protein [Paenibacillus sp.]|nr:DNA alkylation repair protein [Paenibacillus sp.]